MKIINLEKHDINVYNSRNEIIATFPASGLPTPRLASHYEIAYKMFGEIPVVERAEERIKFLPPEQPGVIYIVSEIVVDACPDRCDLFSPVQQVKDANGRVIGCRGLYCGKVEKDF